MKHAIHFVNKNFASDTSRPQDQARAHLRDASVCSPLIVKYCTNQCWQHVRIGDVSVGTSWLLLATPSCILVPILGVRCAGVRGLSDAVVHGHVLKCMDIDEYLSEKPKTISSNLLDGGT